MEVRKAGGVFYIELEDKSKAYVATEVEGGALKILETYVPEEHRGKGYAKILVDSVVEYAKRSGLRVLPICSYAISYFMRNRDKRDILVDDMRNLADEEWKNLFDRRLEEEAKKSGKQ